MRWLLSRNEKDLLRSSGWPTDTQSLLDIFEGIPGNWGVYRRDRTWTFWKSDPGIESSSQDLLEAIVPRLVGDPSPKPLNKDRGLKTLDDLWEMCCDPMFKKQGLSEAEKIQDIMIHYENEVAGLKVELRESKKMCKFLVTVFSLILMTVCIGVLVIAL